MRIRAIQMNDGGRLAERIDLEPGLHVIAGLDAGERAAIVRFIADLLFDGTSASDVGIPGGSLTCELADGRTVELVRASGDAHVLVQIAGEPWTDGPGGATADFGRQHLGMSGETFRAIATIPGSTAITPGDGESPAEIGAMLRALVDSGGAGTVDDALETLAHRIASIGRPDIPDAPLSRARQELGTLQGALKETTEHQAVLRERAVERNALVEAKGELQQQKDAAEATLRARIHHEDADRLAQLEEITLELDSAADACASLQGATDFPFDREQEVDATLEAVSAAARRTSETAGQRDALRTRLEAGGGSAEEFPADLERKIGETRAAKEKLEQGKLEAYTLAVAARNRMEEVQRQLADLPDFSRLAADPVEWLSQLASSFRVALRARAEERDLRESARLEVEALEDLSAPYDGLFASCTDFSELARKYEAQVRQREEQAKRHASELHSLQVSFDETRGESRAFLPLGLFCLAVTVVLGAVHLSDDTMETIYFAILTLFVGVIFLFMHLDHKGRLKRLTANIAAAEAEMANRAEPQRDTSLDIIDDMLAETGLDNVRELEARYESYSANQVELEKRRAALAIQEEKTVEAEERIPQLLARFKETFARAGEAIETEDDVEDAAGRAIARYQAYREAKRHATSNRSVLERHELELKRLQALSVQTEKELESLERTAREFVRDAGLPGVGEDAPVDELIVAFRQYREESHQSEATLRQDIEDLERRLDAVNADLERCEAKLSALLDSLGFTSADAWRDGLRAARQYQAWETTRNALQDQSDALLGDERLEELRARVADVPEPGARPAETREALEDMLLQRNEALEQKTAEVNRLNELLDGANGEGRSVSEIEEEIAFLQGNIARMEAEVEATSYAMARMEALAPEKRAEIAARLGREVAPYVSALTGGRITNLHIADDLEVALPEGTGGNGDGPESDTHRICLALRFALWGCLQDADEPFPMLLDDCLTADDWDSLKATLAVLRERVGEGQIVLLTDREAVISAAEEEKISIIRT